MMNRKIRIFSLKYWDGTNKLRMAFDMTYKDLALLAVAFLFVAIIERLCR